MEIKNKNCVEGGFIELSKTMALYRSDRIPPMIESWMIVVPILRMLRGIYGYKTNVRCLCKILIRELFFKDSLL